MISIKTTYNDGNIIYTNINCTLSEAKKYYLNNWFNIGIGENDKMAKCVSVEEINA